jgi:predicted HTH transcriptional regulator
MPPEESQKEKLEQNESSSLPEAQVSEIPDAGQAPLARETETEPPHVAPKPQRSEPLPQIRSIPGQPSRSFVLRLLVKARARIQERKRRKLDRIMEAVLAKGKITNSDVQKMLRVSSATAFRYLDILEKQGKIKQIGATGQAVFYQKTQ